MELPEYLISGAHNNFPVPQKYKNSWYDRVALNYQLRRGIHAKNDPKEKIQGPVQEEPVSQRTTHTNPQKHGKKKKSIHEMNSLDQMGVCFTSSYLTCIRMRSEDFPACDPW